MLENCPHCGYALLRPFADGIGSCLHCSRIFDSSRKNMLLSAAWHLRKSRLALEVFQFRLQLNTYDAHLIYNWVVDEGLSHDEVVKAIESL